ncbi:hypothetical protein GCM10027299_53310 [Larkinella ripae]
MMKLGIAFFIFCVGSFRASAQLVVNQIDINKIDVSYCQVICDSDVRPSVYVDYGQDNFRTNAGNELRNLDAKGRPTERFRSVMQAVNFVAKNGWEVVSFQITHAGNGLPSQYIYLFRRKPKG